MTWFLYSKTVVQTTHTVKVITVRLKLNLGIVGLFKKAGEGRRGGGGGGCCSLGVGLVRKGEGKCGGTTTFSQ